MSEKELRQIQLSEEIEQSPLGEKVRWLENHLNHVEQQLFKKENPDQVFLIRELDRDPEMFEASAKVFSGYFDICQDLGKREPDVRDYRRYEWRRDFIASIRAMTDSIKYNDEEALHSEAEFPGMAQPHER